MISHKEVNHLEKHKNSARVGIVDLTKYIILYCGDEDHPFGYENDNDNQNNSKCYLLF